MPVAWMLTSSGTTEIITFFVRWVWDTSPSVQPGVIMTDRDQVQIAALEIVYPQSQIFLCIWHVLRAIRCHFVTSEFQVLWEKIKAWVITEDTAMFFTIWDEISSDPSIPQSIVKYLATEWLKVSHMWSRITRKNRSIFQEGNTNMLIESYVSHLLGKIIKLIDLRYHHKLKSHYLGGKCNWRIDYIIQALMGDFLTDFQNWHDRQTFRLEGPDLEGSRCQQIQASARNIALDSIQKISDTTFSVASGSRPLCRYSIDRNQSTCDCDDFPRIRFCKHIAAINLHFPELPQKRISPPEIPEGVRIPHLPQPAPRSDQESVDILLKDINALSQQLNALSVSDDATPDLQALKSVKFSLTAAIASANGSRALPEKDTFNPNQKTWAETAERMGVRKAPKRKHSPTGGHTNTERCIGAVKGRRACKYSDPYAAGERSGKRAKPDAISAAANERARAAEPPPGAAVLAPARAPPSAAASGSAARYFPRASRITADPFAYPPSSAAPGLAFSPLPAASPGIVFAPPSAAVTRSASSGTFIPNSFRALL